MKLLFRAASALVAVSRLPADKHRWLAVVCLLTATSAGRCQVERSRHFSNEEQLNYMETVVRVRTTIDDRRGSQGTAVCIGEDREGYCYLLTCAHVIRGAKTIAFDVYSRATYPRPTPQPRAQVKYWQDDKRDLALLKVRVAVRRIAHLYDQVVLDEGDPALSVGCGIGAPPSCQVGRLTGLDDLNDLVFSRGAVGGRSGGLLMSSEGVIGILARTSDDRTHAVHHAKIVGFLRAIGHSWLVQRREGESDDDD